MSKMPAQPPSVLCLTLIHFDFFSSLPVFDSQRLVDWKWTPFLSEMNRFPVPCHVLLRTKSLSTNVTSVVSLLHMHQPLVSFQKITPCEGLSTLLTLVPERILQLHVCGLQSTTGGQCLRNRGIPENHKFQHLDFQMVHYYSHITHLAFRHWFPTQASRLR